MKTVLLTGASGFIARKLARKLSAHGHRVLGISQGGKSIPPYQRVFRASLGHSIEEVFRVNQGVDSLVHCANATGEDEYQRNLDGTSRWLDEARQHGVRLQILLSSVSARPDALSAYGRSKYELERRFLSYNEIALRLALVVGNGGMFAQMRQAMEKSRVVPLLDGGKARVYVVGIEMLCQVLADIIESRGEDLRGGIHHIHQPEPTTLRQVMMSIRQHYNLPCRFVPVPSLPMLWAALMLERLHLRLPVTSTNVRGLRQSRHDSFESDLPRFGYPHEELDDLVAAALADEHEDPVAV
jgi:NADH dehydrogenase